MRVKDTKNTTCLEEEFFRRSPKETAAFLARCCPIVRANDITLFFLETLVD
ncbi:MULTISPECIES: hypothetical protein [unclassified Mesotoga]|uniref:hypothetical protein n=1 Tax=unclassified Mesotoga TaxID=1184398 RepID=UPI0015E8C3AD|nr:MULTISPECIES: hypothetical protein [unclassified Mesotoga]